MPFQIDDEDIAIIESLIKDGRKSFRQISREIKVRLLFKPDMKD